MTAKRKVDWNDGECVGDYLKSPGDFEAEDWFGRGDYTEERRERLKDARLESVEDLRELRTLKASGVDHWDALAEITRRCRERRASVREPVAAAR